MEQIRAIKLEKYMEIEVDDCLIKDKLSALDIPNLYNVGIDFSMDANIFYGAKQDCKLYERINNIKDFNNYDVVMRLLNWSRNYKGGTYCFRILKSNLNEQVNFQEEREYLKCKII